MALGRIISLVSKTSCESSIEKVTNLKGPEVGLPIAAVYEVAFGEIRPLARSAWRTPTFAASNRLWNSRRSLGVRRGFQDPAKPFRLKIRKPCHPPLTLHSSGPELSLGRMMSKFPLVAAPLMVVGTLLAQPAPAVPGTTIPGDGTYRVGVDIQPGVYTSQGGSTCYWARLAGLSGSSDDVIANNLQSGPQVVQIAPTDAAFTTSRCGTWSLASGGGGGAWSAPAPGAATPSSTGIALPPGAQPCPSSGGSSSFGHSAIGSSKTSCLFAEKVRVAYGASGSPSSTPREITAGSPVTGDSYTVTCAENGSLVTCTGGDYAIVYLY
jgi:hypothetical protein